MNCRMDSGKDIQWVQTQAALKTFMKNFDCSKCKMTAHVPIRYQKCNHLFCATCLESKSRCPTCDIPAKHNEVYTDSIVEKLIKQSNVISQIIKKSYSPVKRNGKARSSDVSLMEHDASLNTQNIPKDINKPNRKGETRLHIACIKPDIEAVQSLLQAGANPNTKDHSDWIPLHEAISFGHYDIAKLLLEAGAVPDTPGNNNRTALHEAVIRCHQKEVQPLSVPHLHSTVQLLLQYNADINARDCFDKTPLDYAVTEEVRELLTNPQPTEYMLEKTFTNISNMTAIANSTLTVNGTYVLGVNLSSESLMLLSQVATKHKIKLVKTFTAVVSHVVVEVNDQNATTLNYEILLSILHGKRILSSQWIRYCMAHPDLGSMELDWFEVSGTTGAPRSNTPIRARENAQKQNPKLFNGCYFYFAMNNQSTYSLGKLEFTKASLSKLISEGDGTVLNREPDPEAIQKFQGIPFHVSRHLTHPLHRCSHYIIYVLGKDEPEMKYNMSHIKSLPLIWLIESIEQFELLDPAYMGITS